MNVPRPQAVTSLFHNEEFCRRVLRRFSCHQGFDSHGGQTGLLVQMPGKGSVPPILDQVQVVYIANDRVYMSKVQRVVEGTDGIVKRFVLVGFHRVDPGIVPASQYSSGVHLNLFTTWHWIPSIRTSFSPPANLPDEQVA
jgi:hypothetical protein